MTTVHLRYCTTHREVVPEGFVPSWQTYRDGTWVTKPGICPGYGRVESIEEGGWVEIDRDPCRIVDMEGQIP